MFSCARVIASVFISIVIFVLSGSCNFIFLIIAVRCGSVISCRRLLACMFDEDADAAGGGGFVAVVADVAVAGDDDDDDDDGVGWCACSVSGMFSLFCLIRIVSFGCLSDNRLVLFNLLVRLSNSSSLFVVWVSVFYQFLWKNL